MNVDIEELNSRKVEQSKSPDVSEREIPWYVRAIGI